MNKNIELQRKCSELTSDIEDILHAASLNFKALTSEFEHQSINTLQPQLNYLLKQLTQLQKFMADRAPLFMAFLITRQIQQEQARVRKERLNQYQDKIYDQKRIIGDKEVFFENLLRPKRKRAMHQTPEEFTQMKIREREIEEKQKSQQLNKDASDVHYIKKLFIDQERLRKKLELECTQSSSISQVNVTTISFGQMIQTATERVIPLNTGKENKTHARSASVQAELLKSKQSPKKQNIQESRVFAQTLLKQIDNLRAQNEQNHRIYDQGLLSLKFKKNQVQKSQFLYKQTSKELAQLRKETRKLCKQQQWQYNKVNKPVSPIKRSISK